MAHSPPMPTPASRRRIASCQTPVTKALRKVNIEYHTMVSMSVRTRPNLSPIGPQRNASPQPIRNSANSRPPYNPIFPLVDGMPERGRSSRSEGTRTSAYTKESMPSSVHPPHDAQKPRIWFRVSDGDNAEAESFASFVAERCMTVRALYQTSALRYQK